MEIDYDLVFYQMHEAFAIHEFIFDQDGLPSDYRFLDVNAAFTKMTGLKKEDIVGNTVLEILPGTERLWLDRYAEVVKTRKPAIFEAYTAPLDKWFTVSAFHIAEGCFATLFFDISEQKKYEATKAATEVELRALNEELLSMLEEKNSLVQEVHHRVKNNLQMINSLIEIQADFNFDIQGLRQQLRILQSRIHAIATVHDLFGACEDTVSIRLKDHMNALASSMKLLEDAYFSMPEFSLCIDEKLCLPVDVAIPVSLIVHELIMNSVKHGKKQEKALRIGIHSVLLPDGTCELRISDDGQEAAKHKTEETYKGIGALLIEGLSDQIKAKVIIDRSQGYATTLCFPLAGAGKPLLP